MKNYLKNEEHLTAEDLIEEIYPYFVEFYEGKFTKDKGIIHMNFPNGQKFELSITQK